MQGLQDKHILLGISGGIAAYKSAELVRLLRGAGAQVRVVMTEAAQSFITPLTLQALSGNPVHTSLLDPEAEAGMGHIELAKWADRILIAPASADLMARLAWGLADDLLSTVCLASEAPLSLAPAMNQAMWKHPQTQFNAQHLQQRGVDLWGPEPGEQACGDTGPGRMREPAALLQQLAGCFSAPVLAGVRVRITAGPTQEALDPVRYLSNHSSGKMGYALAQAAAAAGADVTLISGPTNLDTPCGVNRVDVISAEQMLAASLQALDQCDLFIGCAAVVDYRPSAVAEHKIKKGKEEIMELHLIKNPDIIAQVAAHHPHPFCVGFAAETRDVLAYARAKRASKGLDMIIANDVSDANIGFNSDHNAVTLISAHQEITLPRANKQPLAAELIRHIAQGYHQQ